MQPSFHCVANLGDVTPLIYGGAFVLIDKRGVYATELAILEPYGSDDLSDPTGWRLYTVICDRLTRIKNDKGEPTALSDNRFHPDEEAWWASEQGLHAKASWLGCSLTDLFDRALSSDPIELASFYLDLFNYHGSGEFDTEPRELSRKQASLFCRKMTAQINQTSEWLDGWGFTLS